MAASYSSGVASQQELWDMLKNVACSREPLTDANVTIVTDCLVRMKYPSSYSFNPRLCVLLLKMQSFQLFSSLLEDGVTDLWLPLPKNLIRRWWPNNVARSCQEHQELCLDTNFSLEPLGRHICLVDAEGMGLDWLELLGSGGFGVVDSVKDPRSGNVYARKTISRKNKWEQHKEVMLRFWDEISGMRRVRHVHCVDLVASCTDRDSVVVFSSPVADVDLSGFLKSGDLTEPHIQLLRRAIGCITTALAYLHQLDIRHGDLKPSNILVHGSNILLTDFGFCLDSSDSDASTTYGNPKGLSRRYSAPEYAASTSRSRLSDIWSLGCVLCDVGSRIHSMTPSQMKEWWRVTGNTYDSYAQNPDATKAWCVKLAHKTSQSREYRWLWSFIQAILLEPERLMRPTAGQVRDRLAKFQTQGWLGGCCNPSIRPGTMVDPPMNQYEGGHLLWPLIDLYDFDRHLACVFIGTDHSIMASSPNMESYTSLRSFLDPRHLTELWSTNASRDGARMHLTYTELVKSLYIDTDLIRHRMALKMHLHTWQTNRTCAAEVIEMKLQLERRPMHGMRVSALIFDPRERAHMD